MIIDVNINGTKTVVDTDKVKIDETDLKGCLIEQPSLFAFVATTYAVYESKLDMTQNALRDKELELYNRYKTVLDQQADGKRVTENLISSHIRQDVEYKKITLELMNVTEQKRKLRAVVQAFDHRRDMLIQLCGLYKEEMRMDNQN